MAYVCVDGFAYVYHIMEVVEPTLEVRDASVGCVGMWPFCVRPAASCMCCCCSKPAGFHSSRLCGCFVTCLLCACLQIAKTLAGVVSKYAQVVLDGCAYAGTGNVLKVQELLALCGEHIETEEATAWKVGMGYLKVYCLDLLCGETHVNLSWLLCRERVEAEEVTACTVGKSLFTIDPCGCCVGSTSTLWRPLPGSWACACEQQQRP
jgi:hypothetical protein